MTVFLLLMFGLGLPLLLLARRWRIYPALGLVALVLVPTLLCIPALFIPALHKSLISLGTSGLGMSTISFVGVAIFVLALIDLRRVPRPGDLAVEREMVRIASLRKKHRVALTISNLSRQAWFVHLKDDLAQELDPQPADFLLRLAPRSRTTVHYDLLSRRRGKFTLECVHLRVPSRWRIWQRFIDVPLPGELHVYPDLKQLGEYAVLARTNRLTLMGVRRTRRIGQDNEFERLRDYTLDDNYKYIDWRSTARRQKLTVKDFQANQSQNLLFLVDCGRMMTNQAAGLSLLDHAFNSLLLLSYVALTRGDTVGMICFSDRIHTFVPPRAGASHMNHLLHACFDCFPQLVESRYDEAFLYLSTKCRKRSLVVFITNVIDEVNAMQVQSYLTNLTGKHLPLGVMLRDRRVFEAVDAYAAGRASSAGSQGRDLFRAAAAAEILTWRHQVLTDLTSKGVLALDAFPEDLTAPLVNRYLEIKARHLL
jgi:uncharacterized protein (DUF58 family)